MHSDVILVLVIGTALAFDFTNGFHDTANVVATSISTRAVPPRVAIAMASLLNFVGAFISLKVAATVANGIVNTDLITPTIVFAGLIGAIAWNLATWYFGLPSSSSHALIGGVVGAAFAAEGSKAIQGDGLLSKVITVAPTAAQLAANPETGQALLVDACREAARDADAVIVGGAALAGMAALLQGEVPVPLIDSVDAGGRAVVRGIRLT